MDILPENERIEFESRVYSNPQIGLDESSSFIEKLRQTQQANNQQIVQDTANLGADVPSNLGGLTGGEGYWTSRYQTPQTNSAVANLRASAQAQALNEVLANEQAMWKKRYQDAYRDYQKRQHSKGDGSTSPTDDDEPNNIDQTTTTYEIGDIQTEGIMKHMFNSKFEDYIKQGLSASQAEIRAKQAIGGNVNPPESLEKKRAYVRGKDKDDYIYKLPNGSTVFVPEGTKLVNTGDDYFIQNLETGELIRAGK